ncbi:hypothetical protein DFH06DRAFT_1307816 [Mycena polygramma]|nr:hypothetical protein DFH06DRAFT_1307816 [Mycena polygramma]
MTTLNSLGTDLLLLICSDLDLYDIISIRQVCRDLQDVTRAKILWLDLLHRRSDDSAFLPPPHLRSLHLLDAVALEALVIRMACLARKWISKDPAPVTFMAAQAVSTHHLASSRAANWLFVASSDHSVSKISCWDLSLVFKGSTCPIAEAYIPGQVETAQLEVQDRGVVLALGLGKNSPSVHVITLVHHLGSYSFTELSRIEGSSHVMMLQGNFVGAHRISGLLGTILSWSSVKQFWTCTLLHRQTVSGISQNNPNDSNLGGRCIGPPLPCLNAAIAVADVGSGSSNLETSVITWVNEHSLPRVLWAYPVVDFDDALGFTVLGNCFGELTIYDTVSSDPLNCDGLAADLTYMSMPYPPLVSQAPIYLGLPPLPPPGPFEKFDPGPESAPTWVSRWSDEDLSHLDPRLWSADWISGTYSYWYQWRGIPGDRAWALNHAFHFPGTISLQVYGSPYDDDPYGHLILRSGNRFLVYDDILRSMPIGPFPDRPLERLNTLLQPCMRPTAVTIANRVQ